MDIQNYYKWKKVFITGTTGFKWAWLAFWLHSIWAQVTWFALQANTHPSVFEALKIEDKIHQIYWDINDYKLLEKSIQESEAEIIFHLAAQPLVRESYKNPLYNFHTNAWGTVNVLEVIRLTKKMRGGIMITTDKVYDNKESMTPYKEEDRLWGYDPYSSSKAMCEIAINSYNKSFFDEQWKKVVSVRAWNVIGWWDWSDDRLIPDIVKSIYNGESLILRNPNSIRPWQYMLEALYWYLVMWIKIFEDDKYLWPYNFWPDKSDNIRVEEIVIKSLEILWKWSYKIEQSDNLHEAWLLLLDNSRAKSLLWWSPKYNVWEVLERTLIWYKTYYEWWDIEKLSLNEINNFNIK